MSFPREMYRLLAAQTRRTWISLILRAAAFPVSVLIGGLIFGDPGVLSALILLATIPMLILTWTITEVAVQRERRRHPRQ